MSKTLAAIWKRPKPFTLVSGNRAAEERPKLAALVSGLFAQSVDIEQAKAAILIHLLQGEPLAGMEMFMSLRSAQAVALNAVVKAKIPDQAKLFERVLKVGKKFEDHRNKFAHWVWAYSDELPNHLCLEDPVFSARFNVMLITDLGPTLFASGPKAEAFNTSMAQWQDQRRDRTLCYDEAALNEAALLGDRAYQLLVLFFHAVIATKDVVRAQLFLELEAELPPVGASGPSEDQHGE